MLWAILCIMTERQEKKFNQSNISIVLGMLFDLRKQRKKINGILVCGSRVLWSGKSEEEG